MPSLVTEEEMNYDQRRWLCDYGPRGENIAFQQERMVAVAPRGGPPPNAFVRENSDKSENNPLATPVGTNDSQHAPLHRPYWHQPPGSSTPIDISYQTPPGPDNRSTIFRGRHGGRPISRPSEYDNHHHHPRQGYYPQHPPPPYPPYHLGQPPLQPPLQPILPEEQLQDASHFRKRDHRSALDLAVPTIGLARNDSLSDNGYYHHTPPFPRPPYGSSHFPYLDHEDEPDNKRHCSAKIVSPSRDSNKKPSKPKPIYPHLGEKLTWIQSFENLKVYKQTYGNCCVPQKYKENPKLGGWVNKQRKKKKNPSKYGRLTEIQVRQLNEMGFKWNIEQSNSSMNEQSERSEGSDKTEKSEERQQQQQQNT